METDKLGGLLLDRKSAAQHTCVQLTASKYVLEDEWYALQRHEKSALRCYAVGVTGRKSVLIGRSAGCLNGLWILSNETASVELAMPSGNPPPRSQWPDGVLYRYVRLSASDITTVGPRGEVRVTTPIRSAIDIARFHSLRDGVVAMDSLFAGLTLGQQRAKWKEVHDHLKRMAGHKYIGRAHDAFDLSIHLSESAYESLFRVILAEHGIAVEVQKWIGPFRVDLLWGQLAIEIDGASKYEDVAKGTVVKQLQRENFIKEQGYEVIRLFPSEILRNEADCVARVREAKARADLRGAPGRPAGDERWEPEGGWGFRGD